MLLLVFESIGTQELVLIVIAALILFGPRKLPEIGRTLGKSLGEFRRVSDEFKRTWQMEVELEKAEEHPQQDDLTATAPMASDANGDADATVKPDAPLIATPASAAVSRDPYFDPPLVAPADERKDTTVGRDATGERSSQLVS